MTFSSIVSCNSIYRKVTKFWTQENLAVIYLKFKQRCQTLAYFAKKMQMEKQTVKTLIRLLLKEQSDLGLHFLPRPISQKIKDYHCIDRFQKSWKSNMDIFFQIKDQSLLK